ncbi:ornithine aminotransferase [Marasmius oreades]|uniref:Ornithine aminotransferase n=1 Tax=Marasmius oreades TaxID=181124 RepID=A0A9P7RQX9_9AGAR|nr:ornithine aminotransferase [Marasmius oreades]KAG7087758.1 ornithine aminotransferase [Marasmius oreades]
MSPSAQTTTIANGVTNGKQIFKKTTPKYTSEDVMSMETEYGAHNYHPLPVVFDRAKGAKIWDPEGVEYIDMLSAYSAVNQGHCHPKILQTLVTQAQTLTLSSRAFYNSAFAPFAQHITNLFSYDMVLPMNTGAEAVESAIKLARRWGYGTKGIPANQAIVLSAEANFHGRTVGIISMSTDPDAREGFGPYLEGVGCEYMDGGRKRRVRYGVIEDLERALELYGERVAGFLVEPIQGEAGVVIPPPGYLTEVASLCKKHNVLFICDEIQTGLGRTGKMLACQWENVKPDVILLGKALSGGVYPISALLASRSVMLSFTPGSHGSTYGGNPLACAVATTALNVIIEEDLCARSLKLGELFRSLVSALQSKHPRIKEVRGRGLFNAVVIEEREGRGAWEMCLLMKRRGVLAKPTHGDTIRFSPPLVIEEEDLRKAVEVIDVCLEELESVEDDVLKRLDP